MKMWKMAMAAVLVGTMVVAGVGCGGGDTTVNNPSTSGGGSGGGGSTSTSSQSWAIKDGVYRLYGSNTVTQAQVENASIQNIPAHPINESDWTLIGEASTSYDFDVYSSYKWIMITWSGNPMFYFDSANDGMSDKLVEWTVTNGLTNYENFYQHDGKYASTTGPGFVAANYSPVIDPIKKRGKITVYMTKTP